MRYNPKVDDELRRPHGQTGGGQWTVGDVLSEPSGAAHNDRLSVTTQTVASNTSENAVVKYIAKKLGLTLDQQDRLHRIISKQNYTPGEVEDIARDLLSK